MKPWRADPDSRSDFDATPTAAAAAPARPSAGRLSGSVVGVCASTVALGFAEACLHVEQRPIPLRFAAKFALTNALPSAVWATVPPQYVAASQNLPSDRLVAPATVHGELNLQPRRANRILAIKTLRSLRYAAASYGVVWSLWRQHESSQQARVGPTPVTTAREDSARASTPSVRAERVVRLAPVGSSLSRATAAKHGDHVLLTPWRAVQRGDAAIDWSMVGLEEKRRTAPQCKVLEIEIAAGHEDAAAFLAARRTAAGASEPVVTIALVDASTTPAWHARGSGVDVYFFALSGIVQFLREHFDDATSRELVLVSPSEEDGEDQSVSRKQERGLLHSVRRALVHRCGISTSIGLRHVLQDVDEEDASAAPDDTPPQVMTAVFAPTVDAAVALLDRLAGLVPASRTLVVVEDSLAAPMPPSLAKCAGVLSVTDLNDAILQRIRTQLRDGEALEAIQLSIFEDFGEQSALLHRADAVSEVTKYI